MKKRILSAALSAICVLSSVALVPTSIGAAPADSALCLETVDASGNASKIPVKIEEIATKRYEQIKYLNNFYNNKTSISKILECSRLYKQLVNYQKNSSSNTEYEKIKKEYVEAYKVVKEYESYGITYIQYDLSELSSSRAKIITNVNDTAYTVVFRTYMTCIDHVDVERSIRKGQIVAGPNSSTFEMYVYLVDVNGSTSLDVSKVVGRKFSKITDMRTDTYMTKAEYEKLIAKQRNNADDIPLIIKKYKLNQKTGNINLWDTDMTENISLMVDQDNVVIMADVHKAPTQLTLKNNYFVVKKGTPVTLYGVVQNESPVAGLKWTIDKNSTATCGMVLTSKTYGAKITPYTSGTITGYANTFNGRVARFTICVK